jgi:uncharacterized membrane protein (UPF0127 family)
MNRLWALSLIVIIAVIFSGCLGGGDNDDDDIDLTGKAGVEFTTLNGTKLLSLTCELADTPDERARGLMNRSSLGRNEGMVFYYDPPREVAFWMKNTLIPLDMIFVNSDFEVVRVSQADPEPGVPDELLQRYPSGEVVRYVIEMNQGLAEDFDIVPGVGVTIWEY